MFEGRGCGICLIQGCGRAVGVQRFGLGSFFKLEITFRVHAPIVGVQYSIV